MAWEQLSPTKPHVAYAVVAFFSVLFSLFSLFIKEKLYLGEAPLATIHGLIVGPHCLNWFNPLSWGNWMAITLEISRVLLCIEIVAVSVELPKKYILKHWWSMFLLLFPCMITGFLLIGLFTWAILPGISFSEGLLISACITATDPVLAQAVVGKGKFAQRVPAHLRNLLTAESACNDGISVPFTYLALNLIVHAGHSKTIAKNFLCNTVLWECGFGIILGTFLGWAARKLLAFAERAKTIDAESYLAFYVMLAVLCAGFGSILGCDDLLASFCAGTAFAWDGWFTRKTEESHVSTVIDLLLNLSFFIYFGSIIPWHEFNDHALGLDAWRLVCLAICVLIFRRIPSIMGIRRICPDINNWKEALFVGHFGPIGVGAIYTSIVSVGDLEAEALHIKEGPTLDYPDTHQYYRLMRIVWPCVCFLIVTSIIVHGSSVAVIVLGKHLQSMSFTLTFTRTETSGGGWTTRLPRMDRSGHLVLRHTDKVSEEEDVELSDETPEEETESSEKYLSGVTATPAGLRRRKMKRRMRAKQRRHRRKMKEQPEKEGQVTGTDYESIPGAPKPVQLDLKNGRRRSSSISSSESYSSYSSSSQASSSNGESLISAIGSVRGEELLEPPPKTPNKMVERRKKRRAHVKQKISDKKAANRLPKDKSEEEANKTPQVAPVESVKSEKSEEGSPQEHTEDTEGSSGQPLSRMVTYIKGRQEVLDKLHKDYGIDEKDLEPIYQNNELRVPTHGYNNGDELVIEDQHGEIMRKIPKIGIEQDQSSIGSIHSVISIQPLRRTLSKISAKLGFGSDTEDEEGVHHTVSKGSVEYPPVSHNHKIVIVPESKPRVDTNSSPKQAEPVRKVSLTQSILSALPKNRIVRTILPNVPEKKDQKKKSMINSIRDRRRLRRLHISEKLHGFRVNDSIIIEDKDGNVVGTYKINPKKDKLSKPNDLMSKAMDAIAGHMSPKPDKESNFETSSTFIPEDNTVDDPRIERKLRAFVANPNKPRLGDKDAREAQQKYDEEHDYDSSSEESGSGETSSGEDDSISGSGDEEAPVEPINRKETYSEEEASEELKEDEKQLAEDEDDEEKVAQDVIDKQKKEGEARRRRREGSIAHRLKQKRAHQSDN